VSFAELVNLMVDADMAVAGAESRARVAAK
jgi:hypothetical protein